MRFTIEEVLQLRENNWQTRRALEGPLKIAEIHRKMQQEEQQQPQQHMGRQIGGGSGMNKGGMQQQQQQRTILPRKGTAGDVRKSGGGGEGGDKFGRTVSYSGPDGSAQQQQHQRVVGGGALRRIVSEQQEPSSASHSRSNSSSNNSPGGLGVLAHGGKAGGGGRGVPREAFRREDYRSTAGGGAGGGGGSSGSSGNSSNSATGGVARNSSEQLSTAMGGTEAAACECDFLDKKMTSLIKSVVGEYLEQQDLNEVTLFLSEYPSEIYGYLVRQILERSISSNKSPHIVLLLDLLKKPPLFDGLRAAKSEIAAALSCSEEFSCLVDTTMDCKEVSSVNESISPVHGFMYYVVLY
jgi:hypothetical protein